MLSLTRRTAAVFLSFAITMPLLSSTPAVANGKTGAGELAKYLNPFQKKGYLNESQDRVIKKKKFKAGETAAPAEAVTNKETGFFAIIPNDKISDIDYANQLLATKRVNGLSVLIPWSTLQPGEDNFNWQPVDQLLDACAKNGKTLILRVSSCGIDAPSADGKEIVSDLPKWVVDSGIKTVKYSDPQGREHMMPLFWDKDYLAKWSNFVVELAERYDKNPNLHSIGITGGGFQGSTAVLPPPQMKSKNDAGEPVDVKTVLKKDFAMNQRELVTHWKYVSDIFPKHFQTARLNFNINAPVPGRAGEDSLDEIADYLLYRYGERVFVTRQGFQTGKHKFDDYRLLLKYQHDTVTGVQLPDSVEVADLAKIAKNALDDGISYAELPASVLKSEDATVQAALDTLASHIGYQIIHQKSQVSDKVALGEPLKASFTFVNIGAAVPIRPERMFDKDQPSSYRLQIELRDSDGKAVLQNVHTPPTPTTKWTAGQTITWEEELKTTDANKRQLPPGEYTAFMSLVDPTVNRKILFINATSPDKPASTDTVEVGKVLITTASAADTKMEANAKSDSQGN